MTKLFKGNAWVVVRPLLFALCVVFAFAFGGAGAPQPAWQPSPGHTQIPIGLGRRLTGSLWRGRKRATGGQQALVGLADLPRIRSRGRP